MKKIKFIKSTEVSKKKINLDEPQKFYCVGVPGKSFAIRLNNKESITGNTLHVEGNASLFRLFCEEHPNIINDNFKKSIYDMARKMVELEDEFIDITFAKFNGKSCEGLTKEDLKQYIRYITDRRLVQLGLKENFNIEKNPLSWIDWIMNGTDKSNFFETRVTEYSVAGMTGDYSYDFI